MGPRAGGTLRRTGQIGPSSHTNQYCRGVLNGNWAEERLLDIERTQNKPAPIPLETTYGGSFVNPRVKADGASLAPPPLMKAPDAGQNLLLGHSQQHNNNNNTNNISKKTMNDNRIQTQIGSSYSFDNNNNNNNNTTASTATTARSNPTMPIKKVDALQAKQQRWKQERDPDFARHGVPQLAEVQHERVRSKAPHFVNNFADDPTLLGLRQ